MAIENGMSNPAFRGVYKISMPDIRKVKDEKEKNALAETMINTIVMGANYSVAEPRVSNDNSSVYFKIDDKNDKNFETGFKAIIDECNKQFNADLAKKVYMNKVDLTEFNKAEVLK